MKMNQGGFVRGILVLAVLFLVAYAALKLGLNYFDNFRLEERVEFIAMECFRKISSPKPDERISIQEAPELAREAILEGAKLMDIPLEKKAVKIRIYTGSDRIFYDADVRWSRSISLLGLLEKDFTYVIKLKRDIVYQETL